MKGLGHICIPRAAVKHLIAAAELELGRQKAIQVIVGDDWPADFDPNDIGIYMAIAATLYEEVEKDLEYVKFEKSKVCYFLQRLVPGYLEAYGEKLTDEERDSLKAVALEPPLF